MVGNRVNIVIIGMFCLSGKLSVDKLRLKLDNAMKKNDPDLLEKVIAECVGSGHVELMPDIQEARLHLESLEDSDRGLLKVLSVISDKFHKLDILRLMVYIIELFLTNYFTIRFID